MRPIKRVFFVLKKTGALKIFAGYIAVLAAASVLLRIFEPSVDSFFDGFWYSFVASTTVGFGDIAAVSPIGRIITVFTTLYGIVVVAMVTGVIVSYYNEYLHARQKETISVFMEKLEILPELSKEELTEISEQVKRFKRKI